MAKARKLVARDPETGERFERRTAHDYKVCRVERLASEFTTEIRNARHVKHVAYAAENAKRYTASVAVLKALETGTEPPADAVALLRGIKAESRSYNEQKAGVRTMYDALVYGRTQAWMKDIHTSAKYQEYADDSAAAAAKTLPTDPAPPMIVVTWHHRLDLAQRVKQQDPRSTVAYLSVDA